MQDILVFQKHDTMADWRREVSSHGSWTWAWFQTGVNVLSPSEMTIVGSRWDDLIQA